MKIYLVIKYHADLSNKELIEHICNVVEKNHQIICAHRDLENWGHVSLSENELMKRVFEIIDSSDALFIEFSEGGVGIGIEAGYAKAKNIPIYVFKSKKNGALSSAMKGTCNDWYEYETNDELESILESILENLVKNSCPILIRRKQNAQNIS